jgi:two-component sensor histidine kinase
MAFIHEKLWAAQDLSRIEMAGYVRAITSGLFSLYQVKPGLVSLAIDIPDVVIDINTAIPVGLILNELMGNSLKHAFLGGTTGEITLVIRDEGSTLSIICQDNGAGMPPGYDWENPDTVGLVLVHSLVGQLQGTIEKEPGNGTRFLIRLQKASGESGTVRGTYNQITE